MDWKWVGSFLVGLALGVGSAVFFNSVTKTWDVCYCSADTQGGNQTWNAECPADVINYLREKGVTCP